MNLSIDIESGSGYMACTITGKWVKDELKAFAVTVSTELKKRGCSRILADLSRVSGGPPPEMDRFFLGEYVASVFSNVKLIQKLNMLNNLFSNIQALPIPIQLLISPHQYHNYYL